MKYIMLKRDIAGVVQLVPIIFPNFLVHKHIAQAVKNLPGNPYKIINYVHSAGEILLEDVDCFGRSESLKISAKETDSDIINSIDYEHGIVI